MYYLAVIRTTKSDSVVWGGGLETERYEKGYCKNMQPTQKEDKILLILLVRS